MLIENNHFLKPKQFSHLPDEAIFLPLESSNTYRNSHTKEYTTATLQTKKILILL